jgi:hypothetical protein
MLSSDRPYHEFGSALLVSTTVSFFKDHKIKNHKGKNRSKGIWKNLGVKFCYCLLVFLCLAASYSVVHFYFSFLLLSLQLISARENNLSADQIFLKRIDKKTNARVYFFLYIHAHACTT